MVGGKKRRSVGGAGSVKGIFISVATLSVSASIVISCLHVAGYGGRQDPGIENSMKAGIGRVPKRIDRWGLLGSAASVHAKRKRETTVGGWIFETLLILKAA